MERTVNTAGDATEVNGTEGNPEQENVTEAWRDDTTEDAILIIKEAVKAIKPK